MAESEAELTDPKTLSTRELRETGSEAIKRIRSMVEDMKAVQEHETRVLDSNMRGNAFRKSAGS